MEMYLIGTIVIGAIIFFLMFKHVRSHEKSDSEIMAKLTRRKKTKK